MQSFLNDLRLELDTRFKNKRIPENASVSLLLRKHTPKFSNAKLILKNDHADRSLDRSKKRENHILLEAEPQSGKTLAGFLLISHLRSLIGEKCLEFDESNFDTSVSVTLETDSELQKLCEFRSRQEKINIEFRADLSDLMNFKKRQEKSAIDFVAEMKDLQEKQGIQRNSNSSKKRDTPAILSMSTDS